MPDTEHDRPVDERVRRYLEDQRNDARVLRQRAQDDDKETWADAEFFDRLEDAYDHAIDALDDAGEQDG